MTLPETLTPSFRAWTPALAAQIWSPVLALEEDYEERLAFAAEKYRIVLALGGIPIEIRTDSAALLGHLKDNYGAFLEESEPQVRLAMGVAVGDFPLETLMGTLVTYADGSRIVGKFRGMAGFIDGASQAGRGLVEAGNLRQDVLNYFRLVIGAMTPPLAAVLFHTAALVANGRAYLFYGASTAGKSTVTKLSAPPREVMTDDMLVLRDVGGKLHAATCGFWGGETKSYPNQRIDLPVAAMLRLRKADSNSLKELRTVERVVDILCQVPNMQRPDRDRGFLLDFARFAATSVPFYELAFHKKDDSFWDLLSEIG